MSHHIIHHFVVPSGPHANTVAAALHEYWLRMLSASETEYRNYMWDNSRHPSVLARLEYSVGILSQISRVWEVLMSGGGMPGVSLSGTMIIPSHLLQYLRESSPPDPHDPVPYVSVLASRFPDGTEPTPPAPSSLDNVVDYLRVRIDSQFALAQQYAKMRRTRARLDVGQRVHETILVLREALLTALGRKMKESDRATPLSSWLSSDLDCPSTSETLDVESPAEFPPEFMARIYSLIKEREEIRAVPEMSEHLRRVESVLVELLVMRLASGET